MMLRCHHGPSAILVLSKHMNIAASNRSLLFAQCSRLAAISHQHYATLPNRACLLGNTFDRATPPCSASALFHGNYQQCRYFDARKRQKKKKVKNPFKVLGIPQNMPYKDAKRKFLKIAMKNHPDTASTEDEDQRDKMRDVFISARIAFESLVECPEGLAILKSEKQDAMDNFDSWFKGETGFDTPFQFDMDPQTMKEVASMTDSMSVGLDRDGGMWTLAKMVSSAVKSGGDSSAMLRLDAGEVKDKKDPSGNMRRKRRF